MQRFIRLLLVAAVVSVARPAIGQTRSAEGDDETRMTLTRAAWIVGGFAASTTAAGVAWAKELDLKAKRQEVQKLPAGAPEWSTEYAEARKMIGARDFWGAVAVGVGAVSTIALATVTRSPSASVSPGTRVDRASKPRAWTLGVSPLLRNVTLALTF